MRWFTDLAEWSTSRAIECRLTPNKFTLTNPGGRYGVTADRLGIPMPYANALPRLGLQD
jgi:hypothetical protein